MKADPCSKRLLAALAVGACVLTSAGGGLAQGADDALPRHPIPYRLLDHQAHKLKPKGSRGAKAGPSRDAALRASPLAAAPSTRPPAGVGGDGTLSPAPPGGAPSAAATQTGPTPREPKDTPQPPPALGGSAGSSLNAVQPQSPGLTPTRPGSASAPLIPAPPVPAPPVPAPPALAAPPAVGGVKAGAPLNAVETAAFADGEVSLAMHADHIPGVAIAVVQNGALVMEKGYGAASASPYRTMDPRRTLVRLGSLSAIFTRLLVVQDLEARRLALNQPVNAALPEPLRTPDEGFGRPILLSQLLAEDAGFEDRTLGRSFIRDPESLASLDATLQAHRPRRVRPPGQLQVPSDYASALAGALAAHAAGRPFEDLVEEQILKPLGLQHTSFREPYAARNDLPAALPGPLADAEAQGFRWTLQGLQPQPFAYAEGLAPALSASATADDMARLMLTVLGGGRLGQTVIYGPRGAALVAAPLESRPGGLAGRSAVFALRRLGGGLDALSETGSALDFHSAVLLVPSLNLGIFIAADSDTAGGLVGALPSDLVRRFYATGTAPDLPVPDLDISAASGEYLAADRAYHGLEAFADRLVLRETAAVSADAAGLTLTREGRSITYASRGGGLFQAGDGRDLFVPLVGGEAPAFILGSGEGGAERITGLHALWVLAAWAAAVLVIVLATACGLFIRDGGDLRETREQTVATVVQVSGCLAFTAAFIAFGLFLSGGVEVETLMFNWPNQWLVVASWCALLAALLTVAMAAQLPGVWREGRRVQGWSAGRKLRYCASLLVFIGFLAVLAAWGGLEPWTS